MRRNTAYILIAMAALVSCVKNQQEDEFSEEMITFAAQDNATTKALLNNSDLNSEENRIRVVDVLTEFTGSVSWMNDNSPYYINDEIVCPDSDEAAPVWDMSSGKSYPWTTNGTHHFFAWLSTDMSQTLTANSFFGTTLEISDPTNRQLSIPTKEMNRNTAQFDFIYSGVTAIDAAVRTVNTPVTLEFYHLFTGMNLTLNNTSGNTIILKSVTLTGMKNRRSATVSFTSAVPTVTTSNLSSTDITLFTSTNPDGDEYSSDFTTVHQLAPTMLMWPQTNLELEGDTLRVVYRIKNPHNVVSDEFTAKIAIRDQQFFSNNKGMDAGNRYSLKLLFNSSSIDIMTSILPWEYEEYDWDYADHSISARSGVFKDGVLVFYRGTGDSAVSPTAEEWASKSMIFYTRDEVMTGRFYIEAPSSGRWQISPYPSTAARYFIISPTSGEIDVTEPNNGKVEFTVRPNPDITPVTTQTLYFNVSMYFNGDWHDANSEFNRKNIKLIYNAN